MTAEPPASIAPPARRALTAPQRGAAAAGTMRCLHAEVTLADPAPALELRRARARAVRGDDAWRERLVRYEHGDVLILELTASAVIQHRDGGEGRPQPAWSCHEAVWIDRATALRPLRELLRALVRRDFETVAAGLRNRGIHPRQSDEQITVELSIDPAVTARLAPAPHSVDDDPSRQADRS